jgi:dTDP-4-amino-4,6-dideoxygalactose transaminase
VKFPFAKPFFSDHQELKSMKEVYDSGIFVHGSKSSEFEQAFRDFTGAHTASSVSNCTTGLHLAHHALSSQKKGKVICPAMTHVATANAIVLSGNTPVFVDCDIETGNIDINKIKEMLDDTFVGISIVHFNGSPCEMDEIMNICYEQSLYLVEDCALALGAKYKNKHVGLFGDFGCFSFHPAKQLCTGEGGMVISKNDKQQQLDLLKAFGVDRSFLHRASPGQYDVVDVGFNFRMPELPAALGVEQMKKATAILESRERNYQSYMKLPRLADRSLIQPEGSSRYCFIMMLDSNAQRSALQEKLREEGIGSSVYYPNPVCEFAIYKKLDFLKSNSDNAAKIAYQSIALPVGPHLTEEDADHIGTTVSHFLKTS